MKDKSKSATVDSKVKLPTPQKKTNEYAGYYFSSTVTIKELDTGKTLLKMRCD